MNTAAKSNQITPQVYVEQIAQLYRYMPLSIGFNLINGAIVALVLWPQDDRVFLLTWLAFLYVVCFARLALLFFYNRSRKEPSTTLFWNWVFFAGIFITGSIWGTASLILFPTESIEHQSFLIIMLAGMTAAAVSVLSAQIRCFLAFAVPVLTLLFVQLVSQGTTFSNYMAGVAILYLIGMTFAARGANRTILAALTLRFDNHELTRQIENRQIAENALYEEKERLQTTLAALTEGVVITTKDSRIVYMNPAAERLTGWTHEEATNLAVESIFHGVDEQTTQLKVPAVRICLNRRRQVRSECVLVSRQSDKRLIEEVATPLRDRAGTIVGAVAVLRDVTSEKQYSRELAHQASHDALTQLPNRLLLWDRLNHAIEKAARGNYSAAVLFMDLDRFKTINDSLGHVAGDTLLKIISERLSSCVRKEDTVARLGGDEFVVILERVLDERLISMTTEKITELVSKPIFIDDHEIFITTSIGITLFPKDGSSAESLLKNADTAMYRTKQLGRNGIRFYSPDLNTQALEELKTEQQLRCALSKDEFELFYQPLVDLRDGRIIGAEALLRWHCVDEELRLPKQFIAIAEESDCIIEIGEWVLSTACRQVHSWKQQGVGDLRIAVNFSPRQINRPDVHELIAKVLKETEIDPASLELEITESLLMADVEENIRTLQTLKLLGIRLAIDDFGTGYSSLSYLKNFPVDTLKIDQSFIHDIAGDPGNAAIVSSIITLGHGLNLSVIAEGVETAEQLKILRKTPCDGFQGYYFSSPVPADEMSSLIQARTTAF